MDFGFTLKPDHSIERTIALTRQAEECGFTYGWLFDSHVLWKEPYPLLTLMAQATSRMRLGTCVTNPASRLPTVTASALAVLDELGIGRFAVCGLSLGGMVAMWLGANAPERVGRVVLACTGAKLGTADSWSERAALVRREGTAAVAAGVRERWFTPAFRDSAAAQSVVDELLAVPAEGYALGCESVGAFDFRDELGRIGQPVLVVAGAEDPVASPEVVDALAGGIPDAALVTIPHAAHLANVEQPDAFTAAVLSHLDERAGA